MDPQEHEWHVHTGLPTGDPGNGIGGYDLKSPADRAFSFDYEGSGKLNYLAVYRPGTGTIWILKRQIAVPAGAGVPGAAVPVSATLAEV